MQSLHSILVLQLRDFQYNEAMIMKAYVIPVLSCLKTQGAIIMLKAMYIEFSTEILTCWDRREE